MLSGDIGKNYPGEIGPYAAVSGELMGYGWRIG